MADIDCPCGWLHKEVSAATFTCSNCGRAFDSEASARALAQTWATDLLIDEGKSICDTCNKACCPLDGADGWTCDNSDG